MPRPRQEKSDGTRRYLREIRRFPILPPAEERRVLESLEGRREEMIETLVHSNLSFVLRIAGEFRHLGVPFDDLVSEGNVGLLQAARRFDSRRGARFITYAVWWIRKAILKAVGDHLTLVHVPSYQIRKRRRLLAAEEPVRVMSIDRRVGENEAASVADLLTDENQVSAEEDLIRGQDVILLRRALESLTLQERYVLVRRFGLEGGPPRTLREVAEGMERSRERVRQIENHAKRKVRSFFAGLGGEGGGGQAKNAACGTAPRLAAG